MKRKTSKEVLAESFREVAEHKNIDKITVKDITENCGYSPATFYRQFKDKYDIIAWDYTQELEGILSGANGSKQSWGSTLKTAAKFFRERKTYFANLFLHTGGMEAFITNMQDVHLRCMKDIVLEASDSRKFSSRLCRNR